MASFRAAASHREFTSPDGQLRTNWKLLSLPNAGGVVVISSSQRLRPSSSRIGRE